MTRYRRPEPPGSRYITAAGARRLRGAPESLAFSLRGSLECAMSDHLRPMIKVLKKAVKETPQRLRADWMLRQRKEEKGRVH